MYYRHGCHLCEDFELALGEFMIDHQIDIDMIIRDVDSKPEWLAKFNESVPILFLAEQEVCRYYFEPATLQQKLAEFT